jgi:hypothetical protein
MRVLKQFMLLVMVTSLITLTSCSSDDDSGNNGGGGSAASGTLTAKVDGANYQSLQISSSATVANAGSFNNLIIIASNSSGNGFAMTIIGYEGPGTYKITGADINIMNTASYSETDISDPMNPSTEIWQAPYDNTEVGEVIVTEETDSKVKGTFYFRCKNVNGDNSEKNITEGAFNLNKQTT